jgi:hypothetical protein
MEGAGGGHEIIVAGIHLAKAPDVSGAVFDHKSLVQQIVPWLLAGERLYAVFECKGGSAGFIAITDQRLLFHDKTVGRRRRGLTTLPYSRILSVSTVDEGRGPFGPTTELLVRTASDELEFAFRGGDRTHRAYQFIMMALLQRA